MRPPKVSHPYNIYHLNVYVALVGENDASDQEQHEIPQAIFPCEVSLGLLLVISRLLQLIGPTKVLLVQLL